MRQEVVNEAIWQECLGQLESEVNGDQFETYLRPLQADFSKGGADPTSAKHQRRKKSTVYLLGQDYRVLRK